MTAGMTSRTSSLRRGLRYTTAALILAGGMSHAERAQCADDLRAPGAKMQAATSLAFAEGPVYSSDGSVYFTDSVNDRIMQFVAGKTPGNRGTTKVFRSPAGRPNGLAFDLKGRLLVCESNEQGGNRRVTRTEKDGRITILADHYQGKRLNSPNDIDIDAQGRIYFTDPRYGDRSDMELDKECVYRIDCDGALTCIIDDAERPNGLAVSADQKTLYVIDNNNSVPGGARKIYAYELRADGSAGRRHIIHDFKTGRGGDGMCLDVQGNLYVAAGLSTPAPPAEDGSVKGGVYVFSPSGKQLDFIPVPEDTVTNVAFGDPDLRTLYITAGMTLFRIRLRAQGYLLWPPAKN
jgi:gluconolactonase